MFVVVRCLLLVVRCLFVACGVGVWCSLLVVRFPLFVVCCVLFDGACWLFVVGS